MILPSKIWIKIYGKYQEKRKIKKKAYVFVKRLRNAIKKSVVSRLEMKIRKGLVVHRLLNFMIFNETSLTQVSSSPSLPIDSKALMGLYLYIAQVWRSLRHTHTHTHTHTHKHTHGSTLLDTYRPVAGTFTHNTQKRQTSMPSRDSNPQFQH